MNAMSQIAVFRFLVAMAVVANLVLGVADAFVSPSLVASHRAERFRYPAVPQYNKRFSKPLKSTTVSIEASSEDDGKEEKQSVGAASFSLIKAIVGSGVLALPSGLAVMSDVPKAYVHFFIDTSLYH